MPLYEYRCECGNHEERLVNRDEMDSQQCPSCEAFMHRLFPDTFSFELKYNNKTDMCDWAGNTSQYWNEHKKQKEESGKLSMPVTENIS